MSREVAPRQVITEFHLPQRDGDDRIDSNELKCFSLFIGKSIPVEKWPGSVLLRKYKKGEVVFYQGAAEETAFYIPTQEDLSRYRTLKLKESAPQQTPAVTSLGSASTRPQVLTAKVFPSRNKIKPRSFWERWFSKPNQKRRRQERRIQSFLPTEIDPATFEAPLFEGEMFGEMGCISFMPRSATVVTCEDCELLEFNRNVFEKLYGDKEHDKQMEQTYIQRTLATDLRRFDLFKGLSDSQIDELKTKVELKTVDPGEVICEEGEEWTDKKPLDMFIVRNGVVQVVLNANLSLHQEDVRDWAGLCRRILDSVEEAIPSEQSSTSGADGRRNVTTVGDSAPPNAKLSPLEKIRAQKVAAQAVITPPATPSPPVVAEAKPEAKLSPIEQIRAKKAAAAQAALSTPAEVVIESPPVVAEAKPEAKLSPIEQIRAKQAAAAQAALSTPAEVVIESPPVVAEAKPEAKLSPIEQIRAKQAAPAQAALSTPVEVSVKSPPLVAEAKPEVKLSPIEQIRAKQAAAAQAALSTPVEVSVKSPPLVAEAKPEVKLSPIEQIRAKQAAAAQAALSTPVEVSVKSPPLVAEAKPEVKLSPIEQMRAKKAAAQAAMAAPAENSAQSSPPDAAAKPDAKLSPLELMRAKMAAQAAGNGAEVGDATPGTAANEPLIRELSVDYSGPPEFLVKSWLSDGVRNQLESLKNRDLSKIETDKARSLVLAALNKLSAHAGFLSSKCLTTGILSRDHLRKLTATFPKGIDGIGKEWSEVERRTVGRAVLTEIFPGFILSSTERTGPPKVRKYVTRGECIGEMAEIRQENRSATCIAYTHPSSPVARRFGKVELVRIPGEAYKDLIKNSPDVKQKVEEIATERRSQNRTAMNESSDSTQASTEFHEMGLYQGTQLLTIDLDACTRCGDCVEACIETHDDGNSRLFLDGPRYNGFLIPSACRSCLNPVCMIGCPVGSIGRGDEGQIEIEDWCIGCEKCADQCPYDSIQMHDMGLIQEESPEWLYANRQTLPDDWYSHRRSTRGWQLGKSPFRWQGSFLKSVAAMFGNVPFNQPRTLCFRHKFEVPKNSLTHRFQLSIEVNAPNLPSDQECVLQGAWLNGNKLLKSDKIIEISRDMVFSNKDNILCVEVSLGSSLQYGQKLLNATLRAIPEGGSVTQEVLGENSSFTLKVVDSRAVVCDLCRDTPSGQPACVSCCPHDAAKRQGLLFKLPN